MLAAVAAIVLAGRYLMRPLFRFVAQSGIREIFVAFALLIVVAITLMMQFVGLSAAPGTFLAGVVLAESEYRHELEMDLDPFKGLLLAVFFMAVGAGIDFNLLMANPLQIIGLVLGFVILKLVVLYVIARIYRMKDADSAHFAFSLAQGGEFAFVLISFCLGLGLLVANQAAVLVAIVAMSMALAPLLFIANENLIQPLFARSGQIRDADVIDETARVIIAGHGRFGMTVGRMLQGKGYKAVVLDDDAEQIDALRRFGFKLFYGDASRVDLLEAAGARTAEVLVVAIDEREKISEIVATAKKHFPHLRIFSRAFDRVHAYEILNAGVEDVYREVFLPHWIWVNRSCGPGGKPSEAHRAASAFKSFDEKVMREQARHAGDGDKIVDIVRTSRAELPRILAGDRNLSPLDDETPEDNDARS